MAYSPIVNQFEQDMTYLSWRSEIHRFSKPEILRHFSNTRNAYLERVSGEEKLELEEVMRHWCVVISKQAERHKHFHPSGFDPD